MEIQSKPSEQVSFRTAIAADIALLAAFVKRYYEFDGITYVAEEIKTGLQMLLNDASLGQAWLIQHGSEPVGYLIFTYGFDIEFGGRLATITDLYLEAAHRGHGIGRMALEHVEAYGRSIGLRGLELQVETDNVEARGLYRKFGFEAAERIPMSKRIKAL